MAGKKFKQLIFNELTLSPLCPDEVEVHKRVIRYARTFRAAQEELGTRVVRYADDLSSIKLSEVTNLREFCAKYKREAGVLAILSSVAKPQANSNDEEKYEIFENTLASVDVDGRLALFDSTGTFERRVFQTMDRRTFGD